MLARDALVARLDRLSYAACRLGQAERDARLKRDAYWRARKRATDAWWPWVVGERVAEMNDAKDELKEAEDLEASSNALVRELVSDLTRDLLA